jgi:hypothetical protein
MTTTVHILNMGPEIVKVRIAGKYKDGSIHEVDTQYVQILYPQQCVKLAVFKGASIVVEETDE